MIRERKTNGKPRVINRSFVYNSKRLYVTSNKRTLRTVVVRADYNFHPSFARGPLQTRVRRGVEKANERISRLARGRSILRSADFVVTHERARRPKLVQNRRAAGGHLPPPGFRLHIEKHWLH